MTTITTRSGLWILSRWFPPLYSTYLFPRDRPPRFSFGRFRLLGWIQWSNAGTIRQISTAASPEPLLPKLPKPH